MDNFICKLQIKFKNKSDVISSHKHMDKFFFLKLKEKPSDAEKSLKHSQEYAMELMMHSAKFQRIVLNANRGETFDEEDMGIEENRELFNFDRKATDADF